MLAMVWRNRTTPRTATRQTPFSMVYGCKADLPAEVSIPTIRYDLMTKQLNRDELLSYLDTIEELRDAALVYMAAQQQIIARSFNKNLYVKSFVERDWVLRKFYRTHNNLMQVSWLPNEKVLIKLARSLVMALTSSPNATTLWFPVVGTLSISSVTFFFAMYQVTYLFYHIQ